MAQPARYGSHWPRRGVPLRSGPRASAKTRAPAIVGRSLTHRLRRARVDRTVGALVSPPGLIAQCEQSSAPVNAVGALRPWHSLGAEQSSEYRQTWLPMKARTSRCRTTDPSGQPSLCIRACKLPAGSPGCCDRRHAPRISGSRNRRRRPVCERANTGERVSTIAPGDRGSRRRCVSLVGVTGFEPATPTSRT